MDINVAELTTCSVREEGETLALSFLDQSGKEMSLRLPFRQVEALSMTLPLLLSRALVAQTGDRNARFVFSLGDWLLEEPKDSHNIIMTLQTVDGFRVSFTLTLRCARSSAPRLSMPLLKVILNCPARTMASVNSPK